MTFHGLFSDFNFSNMLTFTEKYSRKHSAPVPSLSTQVFQVGMIVHHDNMESLGITDEWVVVHLKNRVRVHSFCCLVLCILTSIHSKKKKLCSWTLDIHWFLVSLDEWQNSIFHGLLQTDHTPGSLSRLSSPTQQDSFIISHQVLA